MLQTRRSEIWKQRLDPYLRRAEQAQPLVVTGKLTRMVGLTLEAVGCQASIGGRCLIESTQGDPIEAEVVGFHGDRLYLMPIGDLRGLGPDARVIPTHGVCEVAVGEHLLGRVLEADCRQPAPIGPGPAAHTTVDPGARRCRPRPGWQGDNTYR